MTETNSIIESENGFVITGIVDFDTAPAIYMAGCAIIKKKSVTNNFSDNHAQTKDDGYIQIDFSKVTQCNSAGLALLINWIRFIRDQKKTCRYVNLPSSLLEIAKVCNLDTILHTD
ncbi:MAG: hypothetical protein A2298_00745 [Gammaproteobacteria bacterium RIFOXYB2_FULL_38_6]|nr:MAG: hypothetical protein A2298_00745 [Gammaproteobacteria bacterium RIFOXYB2_FULL_38_6]